MARASRPGRPIAPHCTPACDGVSQNLLRNISEQALLFLKQGGVAELLPKEIRTASGSLAEALDPSDPSRTVEGWPAPRRVVVLANVA